MHGFPDALHGAPRSERVRHPPCPEAAEFQAQRITRALVARRDRAGGLRWRRLSTIVYAQLVEHEMLEWPHDSHTYAPEFTEDPTPSRSARRMTSFAILLKASGSRDSATVAWTFPGHVLRAFRKEVAFKKFGCSSLKLVQTTNSEKIPSTQTCIRSCSSSFFRGAMTATAECRRRTSRVFSLCPVGATRASLLHSQVTQTSLQASGQPLHQLLYQKDEA